MLSQAHAYFFTLRRAFSQVPECEPVPVTMDELSSILFCSPRNAKLVLNKMVELGWIEFSSGRGRGHRSSIRFHKNIEDVLFAQAAELVRRGELTKAFEAVRAYGEGTGTLARLTDLVQDHFGYKRNNESGNRTELLHMPMFRPINTLDPAQVFYDTDASLVNQVFSRLVHYNHTSRSIEGSLAHYWESNDDCTTWCFYLKKGVCFHHTRELTGDDVKYTLDRLRHSPHHWLVQLVGAVIVHDPYTVEIRLDAPNVLFLHYLAYTPLSIVPADICASQGDAFAYAPVGTGPFRCVQASRDLCVLEAFTSYYAERPHLDRVEVVRMPDDVLAWCPEQPSEERLFVHYGESRKYANQLWSDLEAMYAGSTVLTMNLRKHGPQSSVHFRKALNQLIDRTKMIADLGEPRVYLASGFQWRGDPVPGHAESREHIQQLLRQSNYRGETLQLYTYDRHATDADWLCAECAQHGILVQVNIVDWAQMLQSETIQNADCILFEAVVSEGPVQAIELYQFAHSFIRGHLSDELLARMEQDIQCLLADPDDASRDLRFQCLEASLKADNAVLFLVHKKLFAAYHPSVRGLQLNARAWVDLDKIWYQPAEFKLGEGRP